MPVQELGEPLTERQLRTLRIKCDPTRETRKTAARRNLNPEDIPGFCDVVREHPTTPLKALLALVNPQFASVRATADGRAGGSRAGERSVPVQELGEPLTERQLENLRKKCDPTRETRKTAARRNLNPEDIPGFCDVVREHHATPLKALLALVNPQFASVRATADGRAGGSPAGERGVPVQELGEPLTKNQLQHLRKKCDPSPTFTAPIDTMIIQMRLRHVSFEAIAKAIAQLGFSPDRDACTRVGTGGRRGRFSTIEKR